MRTRPLLSAVAFAVVTPLACVPPSAAKTLAITNVSVVDVAAGRNRADQVILIDGDRIVAVGSPGAVPVPRGARVLDGRGAHVMPGLWDLHVHLAMTGPEALPLLVANGVTGVRDMGGDGAHVRRWRDSIASGTLLGPRIEMAGPVVENARWRRAVVGMLDASGDSSTAREIEGRFGVETDEDAKRVVDSVAALGLTLIKVRNAPPRAAYFTLLREAKRRGLRVAGHPPVPAVTLAEASDSGQQSIEHLLFAPDPSGSWVSSLDAMPAAARADLYARLVRNGTALVPTLVADVGFRLTPDSVVLAIVDDTAGALDARRRYIPPKLARRWRDQMAMKKLEGRQPDWAALHAAAAARLRELDSAGVAVLTGTDLATPLNYPGFAVHEELALQVREGGRTAARALWGATLGPALLLGRERDLGTVEAGKLADLVILDADPLSDITNVSRIRAVVRSGALLDRAALDRIMREVATSVATPPR